MARPRLEQPDEVGAGAGVVLGQLQSDALK
jgi:hypothetical protein